MWWNWPPTLFPDLTAFRFLSDYAAAPELDVYEKEHLDDRVFDENYLENLRNRQLADEEIEARLEAQRRAREKDDFAREGREGIDEDERQEAEEDSDEDYFDDEDSLTSWCTNSLKNITRTIYMTFRGEIGCFCDVHESQTPKRLCN